MEEFSDTTLFHMHFHVRCHFARLPLSCYLSHGKKITICWQEDSTATAIPSTSASDVMGKHNKTEDITFGAACVPEAKCKDSIKLH
jgi:hypothetical protein